MSSQQLTNCIMQLMEKQNDFYSFDIFLMEKMLGENIRTEFSDEKRIDDLRQEAFRELRRRLGGQRVAAWPTIQKWLGISGKTVPGREHIFRLGLALGLTQEEISEYLRRGIGEPDFQMNDYREVIFLYGCEHNMSYEGALDMIEEFEANMPFNTTIIHHNYTDGLAGRCRIKCRLDREEFLEWMLKNAGEFKGYSMTALEYFRSYKREILQEVKVDAKKQMNELLKQTTFDAWVKSRRFTSQRKEKLILRYFAAISKRKDEVISSSLKANILELLEMSKISVDSNTELLAELYADINNKCYNYNANNTNGANKKRMPLDVNLMNDKYLSQLLKTGIHKEKSLRLTMLYNQLRVLPEGQSCPREVWQELVEYGYRGECLAEASMLEWLDEKRKQQGRRCHVIQRKDLLPLILCVAQKRYLKSIADYHYQAEDAKKVFVSLANMTLSACNMETLKPDEYEFDALLCLCYQPSEMFFLSDVLEVLAEVS